MTNPASATPPTEAANMNRATQSTELQSNGNIPVRETFQSPLRFNPGYTMGKYIADANMPRRLIDLSVTMDNETPADPASMRPAIRYMDHQAGFADFAKLLPGLKKEDLPDGEAAAIE